ncbi:MAG: glycoside hydrolase family 5 protein [Clostridia bacterium]|nr:glycoside hydrolase family 5 protein [Clostridia bacterium]
MKKWISFALACMMILCSVTALAAEGGVKVPNITYIKQYEIPDNEAMAFLKKMGIGWNLGNTFDAHQDPLTVNEMKMESYWCGVKTTKEMIVTVHEAGFNTLRLPVSWHNHVSGDDFRISEEWLNRVQEVVDYAVSEGMYVILNTHHDVGSDYYYPNSENAEVSERYIRCIWEQLSERFVGYDEHLIFESMNEPRLKGTEDEWVFNAGKATCKDAAECINHLNQVFVDTVRASGGNNATRYLMVPGYAASVDGALNEHFKLPSDIADNRVIVSIHAYTPYSFALENVGTDSFKLTDIGQTSEINRFMISLYKTFIANGTPVVIGEFGARAKGDNVQARVDFAAYYAANASARNIPCVWWDNNAHKGNGELFGLLNRGQCKWRQPEIVEALMQYAGYDKIPAKD